MGHQTCRTEQQKRPGRPRKTEQVTVRDLSEQVAELSERIQALSGQVQCLTEKLRYHDRLTLSVSETAEVMGVSRGYVYTLMNCESFPRMHTEAGSKPLISKELLAIWVRMMSLPASWPPPAAWPVPPPGSSEGDGPL